MSEKTGVVIIGTGMAGLMAAQLLKQVEIPTILVEKGSCVGGRLATRDVGQGRADCGAQFFTARSSEFQLWVEQWQEEGLVFEWSRGWSDGSLGATPPDGHPRYAVQGGMRALAEHLAKGLDVRLNTPIVKLAPRTKGWTVEDESGNQFQCEGVLCTAPLPQALELFESSGITLTPHDQATLRQIEYSPSLAGMFWIDGAVNLPPPGAVQRSNAAITWIADNRRKGISPEATIITVHAGPSYSRLLWDLPDRQVLIALDSGLQLYKDYRALIVESHLERWRYSAPTSTHPERCLALEGQPSLMLAGDGFGQPRVEGAARSGMCAGASLVDLLG
ncbi:MAG TPA: FAD-dependent oxidoreductase [Aggregatilineaceae bacterium]|nr:FAD-dependent oxidoreductase [Aggregatilineaceae bacterium]